MIAPTLQSAVNRYMNWRGIGSSAVDLIPEEVRKPIPLLAHIFAYEQARDPLWRFGWDSVFLEMFCPKLPEAEILTLLPDWTHTPGKLKQCTLAVRAIWSRP